MEAGESELGFSQPAKESRIVEIRKNKKLGFVMDFFSKEVFENKVINISLLFQSRYFKD
jgi:hypothetical protein|tara:strand:- start:330 stop:506 length:177 start_codon:yes stop_codon:yes gene_type:complete